MSRHLMAKMRRLGADEAYEWTTGPLGWVGWIQPARPGARVWNSPDEHQSAIVHHGEQRHALEVMPDRSHPGGKIKSWTWGIFRHGPDPELEGFTGTQFDGHFHGGNEWTFPGNWTEELKGHSPAEYIGHGVATPEEARREAERNWELHKQHVDSLNPLHGNDYDLDDIMRRFDGGEL